MHIEVFVPNKMYWVPAHDPSAIAVGEIIRMDRNPYIEFEFTRVKKVSTTVYAVHGKPTSGDKAGKEVMVCAVSYVQDNKPRSMG